MRVDIYRRPESQGRFSYLAVPEGRAIPEDATNTDWESDLRGMEVGDGGELLLGYGMPAARDQIHEKGYAITSVKAL